MNFLKKIFLLFITFSVIASLPLILLGCLIGLPDVEIAEKINEDILSLKALDLEDITKYTLCIKIEQSYPTIEEEFSLPIYVFIHELMEKLGFQMVTGDAPYEATLNINLIGYPLRGFYFPAGYYYTGAKVEGQILLTLPEQEQITAPISGKSPRTSMLDIISRWYPTEPSQAPFWVWKEALINGMANMFGPQVYIKSLGVKGAQAIAESDLVKIGEPAVELLIEALKDPNANSFIRGGAAEALGDIGDKRAVEPLIKTLKDKYYLIRWKGAEALGKIGDIRAVEPLIQALKDENDSVKTFTAWALGDIGDKRAVEPLIHALMDEDNGVRGGAAEALGDIGDKRAVEPLIKALKDEYYIVRWKAAEALGKIGDERAIEPLTKALKDEHENVQRAARGALEKIKAKQE